ncbi:MAG TPA: DUF1829 domain-containing protein [Bryobacteraceae bacterium]
MTTLQEIERLLNDYRAWLKAKTTLREVNGAWIEITTPYLDRHNDALQIYARAESGSYILTDDSYTVRDLEASGCNLDSERRKDLLVMTLNGFGVEMSDDALEVRATPENFPARKHSLIQAMLAVNDLFYTARPFVQSLFLEDVIAWLDTNEIRYTPKIKLTGMSGFDHLFEFVIPKSPKKQQPERIVQPINHPTPDTAENFIFAWTDTRQVRPSDSKAYAVLNDTEQQVSSGVLDAFRNYQIQSILFSRRNDFVEQLAA